MGPLVIRLIGLGLNAVTALALERLGVDPTHVEATVNQTGSASGSALDKLLGTILTAIHQK